MMNKHSERNLSVIQNFILYLTHSGEDGLDEYFNKAQLWTPKIMYEAALDYIKEDHVDGEDSHEDHIVTFGAESSFQTEDRDKELPEEIVVVADFGPEVGTQTAACIEGTDVDGVNALIEYMKDPYGSKM